MYTKDWREKKGSVFVSDVKVRNLVSYEEFQRVVHIQKVVWGHKDVDLTPAHQFTISIKTGAILLGAYVGDELVGFVYSFPALVEGNLVQHSHQLAVMPQFRGRDIGKILKWSQRRTALRKGYEILTWTSDPLLAMNANLNLHALGAEVGSYLQDFYSGIPALAVAEGVPVDRFFIEWHIRKSKVEHRRRGKHEKIEEASLPKALAGAQTQNGFHPSRVRLGLEENCILVEIPRKINFDVQDVEEILEWQKKVGRVLKHYFRRGYRAIDFIFQDRCFYVLSKTREREGA
jgi:predicted GNAT superfamily acetyltransferase